MIKKTNINKARINLWILIYTLYIVFILANDYFCFFFKTESNLQSYLFSFILISFIFLIILRHIKIYSDKFSRYDLFFFLLALIIMLVRVVVPDSSFDTLNYHIYLQENPFSDNINFNFFPSRWINTFSFPLADRMHYFFRLILGYRFGILLNFFVFFLIYNQVKRILNFLIDKKTKNIVCLFAVIVVLTEQIFSNTITYYVDLFAIPFILEFILIIFEKREDKFNNYFILLMIGLSISLKISNIFIILPLVIIYLYRNFRLVDFKTIIIGMFFVLVPSFIYLYNNYLQTGNPVFPFYNSVFKSPFLENTNWIEIFYGPKTLIEKLLWPIYVIFDPRRAFDTSIYYGRIGFGFIISIVNVLIFLLNKKRNDLLKFSLLYILLSLIWSNLMMGYIRYALILEIISGVIIIISIYELTKSKSRILFFISVLFVFPLIYQLSNTLNDIVNTNVEYSWRYSLFKNPDNYILNLKNLDRKNDFNELLKNVDCIAITDYNSGYAAMMTKEIPIIDFQESYINNYGKSKFVKIVHNCKNTYTISTSVTLNRTLDRIKGIGYEKVGEIRSTKANFINESYDLYVFEIRKICVDNK